MPQLLEKNKYLSMKNVILAGAGLGIVVLVTKRQQLIKLVEKWRNPLAGKQIEIIQTADECQRVINVLKRHCITYKVLGFDCEWVTVNGHRRPVALLQLASAEGFCALFRLCHLQQIPRSLSELLEDDDVIKVGVDPTGDARKLSHDYGVNVASTLDLRFLAAMTKRKPQGLAKMAWDILNVHLDKNWRLACSNWEAKELHQKQLNYAANDALAAVELFKKLANEVKPKHRLLLNLAKTDLKEILDKLQPFMDLKYYQISPYYTTATESSNNRKIKSGKKSSSVNKKMQVRGMSTRSKPLYDNCLLEAPDGELLCTIDKNKAQWYLEKNLASEIREEPLTIRLNFEPAGRAVGDVGRYYQMPKENQCVVCGRRDGLIRKNVVPREYRKHFPVVMKSHSCHDILLLCSSCHQVSNISDLKIRKKLSEMCNLLYTHENGARKYIEMPELKQVKSAARALFINSERLPDERREILTSIVLNFYNENDLTDELLMDAAYMDTRQMNDKYMEHGAKVVEQFQKYHGGLTELEKIWREHFLDIMRPKYLPSLWDVNHNAHRLEIRAAEGRVDEHDLHVAGLLD